ncbi:STAS domain-containing protein [Luteolibacter sp. Populi]|uniref:STAS domain-containing protein n=1 Tax=Luteolibacter sp. Populi TaxID=3230487 RepID=UPI0034667F2B
MEFTTEDVGGVAVARLKGVLDSAGVVRMQEKVESQLIGRERKVVLDFSEIDALDPMGLAELLRLSRWVKEGGLRLRVAHAAAHVEEAFRDNMISDVEFFRDVASATKYSVEAPPPRPIESTPPPPPPPKPARPKAGFLKRYWWLLAGVGLLVLGGAAAFLISSGLLADKKVEFLTEDGKPWTSDMKISLKPGAEEVLRFKVKNAGQILPITNDDWIEMRIDGGGDGKTRDVTYSFRPEKDFAPDDTFFYVTAGEGKPRVKSPKINFSSDVKAVEAKFLTEDRDSDKTADGKEGFVLAAGTEGEEYGPDGIPATGGAKLHYRATGHEEYGLKFDPLTGRFSGKPTKPTPEGRAAITITATNEVGDKVVTALLFIAKKKEVETKQQVVNTFSEEIKSRFTLIETKALEAENIALLFTYKDMILKHGEGDILKVGPVFFGKGETKLSVDARRRLDSEFESARFREMAANPKTFYFVLGFADKGNTADPVNRRIIQDRAGKLKDYLAQHLGSSYKLSAEDLKEHVRVIPMQPVPSDPPVIFDSPERARAGEIWLVKDPRK